jgi:TfoX/Sxy family transcriptional regulator of competence genes
MKWRKSPDSLMQAFDHSLPVVDGVERRAMFGYPCAFFHGHLFCGLHQESIFVLLSEARRDGLVAEGATVFEPTPARTMNEYVVVPAEIVADRQRLRALLSDALAHASSLAPKQAKATATKKKARPPKRAAVAVKKPKHAARKATVAKARSTKAAPAKRKATRKTGSKKKRAR